MPTVAETAYPRLKNQVTSRELIEIYTPTSAELKLAKQHTRKKATQLGFLVLLKTFQRLGYFVDLTSVPSSIIKHISKSTNLDYSSKALLRYQLSRTRWRHIAIIREHLDILPYGAAARRVIVTAMVQAARTKNDLADLVNVAIEELVHYRYELPVFPTLAKAAKRVRSLVDRAFYQEISQHLTEKVCNELDSLFIAAESNSKTPWNELKQDPGKPILKNLKALVLRLKWLLELHNYQTALLGIPSLKVKHFASEAISLGAARMKRLEPYKRYALAVSLIATSYARTLDDLAEMFIKRMKKIHLKAKEALELYRQEHQERTDHLVTTFRDVLLAYSTEGDAKDKLTQIETVIGNNAEEMLSECEAHIAYAGNNYYPFLWRYYRSHARHLVSDSQTGRAEIFNSR